MPIQHANVGRRVGNQLLAARLVQTLEQVCALQVEPQFQLARQLRAPGYAAAPWRTRIRDTSRAAMYGELAR